MSRTSTVKTTTPKSSPTPALKVPELDQHKLIINKIMTRAVKDARIVAPKGKGK